MVQICCGLDAPQTDRSVAFCNYTILADEIFEVPDATKDMRFKDNPLVTSDPHIRYYAARRFTPRTNASPRFALSTKSRAHRWMIESVGCCFILLS